MSSGKQERKAWTVRKKLVNNITINNFFINRNNLKSKKDNLKSEKLY